MRIAVLGILACFGLGCGSDPANGVDGARGPAGVAGVQGAKGEAGEPGLAGDVGPAGPVGPAGAPGAIGPAGAAGAVGQQGIPGSGGAISGARLKARYRLGDDGSREYIAGGWFDSQLGGNCSFQRAADGIDRCLPNMRTASPYQSIRYLDAACTQEVLFYYVPFGACPSNFDHGYAAKTEPSCTEELHVYALGPDAPQGTPLFAKAGSCTVSSPVGSDLAAQPILAEVSPSAFVGATGMHD